MNRRAFLIRAGATAIDRALQELRKPMPNAGSYVAESNFFERDWRRSYWGGN